MSTIVVDTNVVSFVMNQHGLAVPYQQELKGRTLAISFMTLAELYEGAFRAQWGTRRMQRFHRDLEGYIVVPSSPEICEEWGRIRAERRRQPISSPDAWIAATARVLRYPLITHNAADFAGIADLEIITRS